MKDDAAQTTAARMAMTNAPTMALSLSVLCEVSWVLRSNYGLDRDQVADAITALTEAPNAVFDPSAVRIGLTLLRAGGDFADGVIAASGAALGGDTFVSFDRRAVKLLAETGQATRLLA